MEWRVCTCCEVLVDDLDRRGSSSYVGYVCFFFYVTCFFIFFFFFQAEDGIRDKLVTGVHTCALPISSGFERFQAVAHRFLPLGAAFDRGGEGAAAESLAVEPLLARADHHPHLVHPQIGRASCRERG